MAAQTQNDIVLAHLMCIGSITPKDAMTKYGIMRLGARIYDLKCLGYQIATEIVSEKNRYGATTRFAKYRIVGRTERHD